MSDFMYVVKCFVYTILIAVLMQIKIAGISIETRIEKFLKNDQFTAYLQDAAEGGSHLLQEGYYQTKNFIMDSANSFRSTTHESHENKASRR